MRDRASTAREILDRRLGAWRDLPPPPARGWIRAIREALGMSAGDLAARLEVTQQAISQMERAEADASSRLETLRRAAGALNCRLVYALVPDEPLETTVDRRAHALAASRLEQVRQTMSLEDQAVPAAEEDRLIEDLAAELKRSRRLWRL